MVIFEINKKQNKKNGYKNFKLSLLEIHNDDCVVDGIGTEYNDNGITWLQKYIEKYKETLIDSNVTVEFVSEDRTDIIGHGETGEIKDGIPILSNATTIGHFTKSYISEIEDIDGNKKNVLIGEGYLDYMRYPNCIDLLEQKFSNGETVYGSVEILKTGDNDSIVYENGYKEFGRIPSEFCFSGYALLGIAPPADHSAQLLELSSLQEKNNSKEETETMDEKTLAMITDSVKSTIVEINSKSAEFESTIADLNAKIAEKDAQIEELNAKVAELDECKKETEKCTAEKAEIETELNAVKAENAKAELNSAIADFSDTEKAYAQAEIDAFNAEPLTSEINSVTAKIYEGIGKATKIAKAESEKVIAEQNAKKEALDIFSDVDDTQSAEDDGSIY